MKLNNKILFWLMALILCSCSKFQKGGIGDDGIDRVAVEIPYFGELYTFDFYGKEITVKIDPSVVNDLDLENNDTAEIRVLVENLKDNNFDKTINMLIAQAKEMELDAFGYRLLLKKFVKEILEDKSKNFGEVIIWYGLRTNDLDAILCTYNKKLLCYFKCYKENFIRQKEDGMEYYPNIGMIYWNDYKNDLPEEPNVLLDFDFFSNHRYDEFVFSNKLPKLGKLTFSKKRSFVYERRVYQLKTSYNKYHVQYLNDLPMRSIGNHLFMNDFSKEVKESFDSIPLWLKEKTEYQKIDFLLTLVNEAFPHSGGDEIEKENYVEQTMKDDFVDCEDRAAMFCYLVKEFTNLNTSLVVTAEHAWSVVSESNNFRDRYIMCDPGMPLGKMLEANKKYRILESD